jgi:glutamine cyclotransferase
MKSFQVSLTVLFLYCIAPVGHAQESLTLLKKYDLGSNRYSEGLDYYNNYLWHTTRSALYRLNLESAQDNDGDGDHDLQAERAWDFSHHHHSESSVWFEDEVFNFTFLDTTVNLSDAIFKLNLNDDETYQWQQVGNGLGATNWGSCRDRRNPGESIIYTGHYDNLLMWYDPESGHTSQTVEVTALGDIEDLGMDQYGTVWASSFNNDAYPGLYRINPDTGQIVGTYTGPTELHIIDGIAIRSMEDHDVMYVTGKNAQFIWEYLVPDLGPASTIDHPEWAGNKLYPNFPNPFNPQTTISFHTYQPQHVRLVVYDIHGRRIAVLTNQQYQAGDHSVVWRGRDDAGRAVPSGEYFFRVEFGGQMETRKAMLLR